MPMTINGQSYYRTAEVLRTVGISRNTLFRWSRQGILGTSERRDRRGWRLFTEEEMKVLQEEANQIIIIRR
jgi:predicted site-specific integrase-resolvase